MKDPICIFLRGRTLQIHEYFRRSDPYPCLKNCTFRLLSTNRLMKDLICICLRGRTLQINHNFQQFWGVTPSRFYKALQTWCSILILRKMHHFRARDIFLPQGVRSKNPREFQRLWSLPSTLKKLHPSPSFHQPSHGKDPIMYFLEGKSRVESSLYAKKWRAPLGTGVKKKWNVNKLQNILYRKFILRSEPAEVDEVVQMRFPPVLVFSSIHPISKILVATISNQLFFPTVCRTSGIARPRRSPS